MAGQKYWKKVKGEWVNTLALERAEKRKPPKTKTEKKEPEEKKGGAPGLHKKIQSNRFALANKLIISKLKG